MKCWLADDEESLCFTNFGRSASLGTYHSSKVLPVGLKELASFTHGSKANTKIAWVFSLFSGKCLPRPPSANFPNCESSWFNGGIIVNSNIDTWPFGYGYINGGAWYIYIWVSRIG